MVIPPNTTSIVKVPKTNFNFSSITVDGTEIFKEGSSFENFVTVKFVEKDDDGISFEVGSGNYSFVAK